MEKKFINTVRKIVLGAALVFLPAVLHAETVSVPFGIGVIGTIGQNSGKLLNATTFATLEINVAHFRQVSDTDQFGGTQGNDLTGVLRLERPGGEQFDIPGAINWRITANGTVEYFGFIPDPTNPVQSFPYPGGIYTLDETTNYAVGKVGTTVTYTDGENVSGNAATSGLLDALNQYLAEDRANAPILTGPSGAPGDPASSASVDENQTAVATFTANEPVEWYTLGGEDEALFTIDPATGGLTFNTPPDFETPGDFNADNIYLVTVFAQNASGYSDGQDLSVTVLDVNEVDPLPAISVSKTVTPVTEVSEAASCATDPVDPAAEVLIPGSCLAYTIEVTSADNGSAPSENITVTDIVPANVLFVSIDSFTNFDSVSENSGEITATAATLAAGSSASFTFRALVQ